MLPRDLDIDVVEAKMCDAEEAEEEEDADCATSSDSRGQEDVREDSMAPVVAVEDANYRAANLTVAMCLCCSHASVQSVLVVVPSVSKSSQSLLVAGVSSVCPRLVPNG